MPQVCMLYFGSNHDDHLGPVRQLRPDAECEDAEADDLRQTFLEESGCTGLLKQTNYVGAV